jgi:hypothetical protein
MSSAFTESGYEELNSLVQFRCDLPKCGVSAVVARIGNAPMNERRMPWKFRAHLAHAVAEADHIVEPRVHELLDVPRLMIADVDPVFPQCS